MSQTGLPKLKTENIEYAQITFEESFQAFSELRVFDFETVILDRDGCEISKTSHQAKSYTETLLQGLNLEMVVIPSGKFTMGSPEDEHERYDDEGPQHEVTVPPFLMGKYAVTQAQWRIVAATPKVSRDLELNPANFEGDDYPVEQVSWLDAEEFCRRLSRETGRDYRLPTEAEWGACHPLR